jgi:hypothetical protein
MLRNAPYVSKYQNKYYTRMRDYTDVDHIKVCKEYTLTKFPHSQTNL